MFLYLFRGRGDWLINLTHLTNKQVANICERLHSLRKSNHLTQEKLSEYLGYTPAYYGQIERGNRIISHKALYTIASFYGVSPDYLVTGYDPLSLEALTELKESADYLADTPYTIRITELFKNATEEECRFCYNIVREILSSYRSSKRFD